MLKSVLVTGANGFVGSHVVQALQSHKSVTVITACRDKAKLTIDFNGEVREGDLRDKGYCDRLVKDIDVICHTAAWSSLWGHAEESRRLFLEPTLQLINAAQAAGISRFINTSTTSAAAPDNSADPMSTGITRRFWPHLCNIVAIENKLRERANPAFQVVNLRLGLFAGQRYALGLLPILVPRLKTHLVPWVNGGRTSMPIIDGRDIGQAFALAATAEKLDDFTAFNVVGPEIPTVKQVLSFLHDEFNLPRPHFSVPFGAAYAFAWLMEKLDPLLPWEPLVTRSIVHLMEEVNVNNEKANQQLGYQPNHHWQEAIHEQIQEMRTRQVQPMSMSRPII